MTVPVSVLAVLLLVSRRGGRGRRPGTPQGECDRRWCPGHPPVSAAPTAAGPRTRDRPPLW